jgi:hypothetical protein
MRIFRMFVFYVYLHMFAFPMFICICLLSHVLFLCFLSSYIKVIVN